MLVNTKISTHIANEKANATKYNKQDKLNYSCFVREFANNELRVSKFINDVNRYIYCKYLCGIKKCT